MLEFGAMADGETGAKWWVKNAIIPVLGICLGGGGLVAVMNHGKGQEENKNPNLVTDTKTTPPASEQGVNKIAASPANAGHVPVRIPVKASEPAPQQAPGAVCYAEDATSHERVPKIGQLHKYQDVRIYWNVTNLPSDATLQGLFGDDTGISDKQPIALNTSGSELYANEVGTRTFILQASQNNQSQILCFFKLDFIY